MTIRDRASIAVLEFGLWGIRGFALGLGFAGAILAVKWVSGG